MDRFAERIARYVEAADDDEILWSATASGPTWLFPSWQGLSPSIRCCSGNTGPVAPHPGRFHSTARPAAVGAAVPRRTGATCGERGSCVG